MKIGFNAPLFVSFQDGTPELSKFEKRFACPANKFLSRIQMTDKTPLFDDPTVYAFTSTVEFLKSSNFTRFLGFELTEDQVVRIMSMPLKGDPVIMKSQGHVGIIWSHNQEEVVSCQLVRFFGAYEITGSRKGEIQFGEFTEKGELIPVFPHTMIYEDDAKVSDAFLV